MAEENKPAVIAHYTCSAPNYRIKFDSRRFFQFTNGALKVTDPQDIADIDALLQRRPDMSQLVRKIDRAGAEAIARAHAEAIASRAIGVRGTMTSSHVREATNAQQAAARDVQLQVAAGGNPAAGAELAKAFAADGLIVTENGAGQAVRTDGSFKPDPAPTGLPGLKMPTKSAE